MSSLRSSLLLEFLLSQAPKKLIGGGKTPEADQLRPPPEKMNTLVCEATEYVHLSWDEFKTVKRKDVRKVIEPYGPFLDSLIPAETPKSVQKYINREAMVYDMHSNDELLVLCYDPKDDDTESYFSDSELEDLDLDDWVNGVKMRDDFELREQVSANQFTGGYLDPSIHWVIRRSALRTIVNQKIDSTASKTS